MLARHRREQIPAAVLLINLHDFRDINDRLGLNGGDQLLVAVAGRLAATLRESETLGRLGGDEFVVLIEGRSLASGPAVVANRIMAAMSRPFDIEASTLPVGVGANIGIATGDRPSSSEMLRDADTALCHARDSGIGSTVVFAESMHTAVQDQRHLSVDLHRALEENQFFLVYQPTINLETNEVTGVEALLRWRHPERGVVQPSEFIPELESSGLIIPVGAWVVATACRQGAAWQTQGHRFSVSVNVSGRQFAQRRIVDDVKTALRQSGFDPSMLTLEMTESTLMESVSETISRFTELKLLGLHIAVDDFGTGYSCLAYLQEFPIDILKIDRSFVSRIGVSQESTALVEMLVQLGKALHLEIIAEGIESDAQCEFLRCQRVDTGQGYLFSRPLDHAAMNQFLQNAPSVEVSSRTP